VLVGHTVTNHIILPGVLGLENHVHSFMNMSGCM
jgi:hypothetical protein